MLFALETFGPAEVAEAFGIAKWKRCLSQIVLLILMGGLQPMTRLSWVHGDMVWLYFSVVLKIQQISQVPFSDAGLARPRLSSERRPHDPNPEHQPRAPSLCFVHGGKHCSAVLQVFLPTDPTVRRRRSLGEAGSHRQGFSPRSLC